MVKYRQVAMHVIKIMNKWINNWKGADLLKKITNTVTQLKVKYVIKLKSIKLCVRRIRHVK